MNERARRSGHAEQGPVRPAWRTLAPAWRESTAPAEFAPATLERLRPLDPASDRNTDAEYAFYHLHGRFQRYAEEYLFASERLLAFVPWTAATTDTWWQRLGRRTTPGGRQAREGVLVVTDRQLLLLRDDADAVGGALYWGYTAWATVHDRLAGVAARDDGERAVSLRLTLRAAGGGETLAWTFPAALAGEARRAATLLAEFVPRPVERRLRRPGALLPVSRLFVPRPARARRGRRTAPDGDAALVTPAERAALERALAEALATCPAPGGAPRRVRATVLGGDDDATWRPRLLAVTQTHLLLVALPDQPGSQVVPLDTLTSVELRRSTLGRAIAWTVGGADDVPPRRDAVSFPPVALAAGFATFAMLRQALALPPWQAWGPDLAEDEERQASAPTGGRVADA